MFNKTEDKKSISEIVSSSNVIAKETKIVGDLQTQGNVRIEGLIEGMVYSKSKIVISESGVVVGNLMSAESEISGKVTGTVTCSEVLFLKKTALIEGDITTSKLIIENGAVFNGKCQMADQATSKINKNIKTNEITTKKMAAG